VSEQSSIPPAAASNPRSPCVYCQVADDPGAELACECTELCAAGRCRGGFRIVVHSVNGAKYLIGGTATALPDEERVATDQGSIFATAVKVRRYVREELNDISSYWRVSVIDRSGVTVGFGLRKGLGGTGKTWSWSGAIET
jgi:hypothetical protein